MSDNPTEFDTKAEIPVNRWPLVFAVFAVIALLFYLLQPILLPFVLGALTGYLGDPLVDRVEERGGSRTFGVILVFLFFTSLSLMALFFAVPVLLQQLDGLVGRIPLVYAWLRDVAIPWLQSRTLVTGASLPQIDWSAQLLENWQSLGKVTASTISRVTGSGLGLLLGLANIALVPVVAFYLMRDWDDIAERVLRLMPKAWQAGTLQMVSEADEVVGAFLRGQFIVMCALGALYAGGLYVVGLELALLLGLIAGLASIVPYLGFMVGITASLVAAWLQFHEPLPLFYVAIVFGIGQLIESMVLTPVLVGDRIGLHPVMVIFALMAGGQLAGFVGVVVALPVAAVIKVFASHALVHYRNSAIYSGLDDSGDGSSDGL
ncbi:AI-2E family transporter [Congregibacter brevis]|uniref:AI-2E family transporter n=1 Tax=Congregibacter brevis TaxID=3081201 RepID=A0ABZ0IBA5_9GAMM|nr:AI-2E family transporter [Congregibacter sp. IMCC45268]